MSKIETENNAESLLGQCKEKKAKVDESLKNLTQGVTQLNVIISVRLQRLTQHLTNINNRTDAMHANNQKFFEKIREQMEMVDNCQTECNRGLDEVRRRFGRAKKNTKKHGLIRSCYYWMVDWVNQGLIYVGLKKPPVKKRAKRKRRPSVNFGGERRQTSQDSTSYDTARKYR